MPEVNGSSQIANPDDEFSWIPPPPPETTKARFARKFKENPFVPIGMLMQCVSMMGLNYTLGSTSFTAREGTLYILQEMTETMYCLGHIIYMPPPLE